MMHKVRSYIRDHIDLAVCQQTEDSDDRYGLPYPYSVPTVGDHFHAMFYWDTYFTNLALLELERSEQVRHNIDNFVAIINRLGYIPNGNTVRHSDRSQPPFFSLMVKDLFERTGELALLADTYPALCREHAFWTRERGTERGLAHYGPVVSPEKEGAYAESFCRRVGIECREEMRAQLAANFLAQAESGWDFNARFGFSAQDFCAVDLNSLLWALERNLADFAERLGNGEAEKWHTLAAERAERMRAFLKAPDGVFYDRNAKTGAFSPYFSVASLYPLFVGMATAEEAAATLQCLPKLMHPWGVAPCEVIPNGIPYQWGAPNGWPCLQVVAAEGLWRYGYDEQAEHIAERYTTMVEQVFDCTGAMWEKYNLDTGSNDAQNEYEMPEMLGWTAGAYLFLKNGIKRSV